MDRPFLKADGVTINWRRLGTVVFGASVLAYFQGLVASLLAAVDVPLALLGGFGNFLSEYLSLLYGFPAVIISSGFAGAIPFVEQAGIAGYLAAITIVLLTLYPMAWVVSRVR